jgi:hypothetical protein
VKYVSTIRSWARQHIQRGGAADELFAFRLTESIHQAGINVRHLGRLYALVLADPPSNCRAWSCAIIMVEMIARVLKRVWCDRLARDSLPTHASTKLSTVDALCCTGSETTSSKPDGTHQKAIAATVHPIGSSQTQAFCVLLLCC